MHVHVAKEGDCSASVLRWVPYTLGFNMNAALAAVACEKSDESEGMRRPVLSWRFVLLRL